jgi:hypothetical protein
LFPTHVVRLLRNDMFFRSRHHHHDAVDVIATWSNIDRCTCCGAPSQEY